MTTTINFAPNQPQINQNQRNKQQTQEQVATGVGAAGAGAAATKYAGKRGLRAQAGEKILGDITEQVSSGIKTVNKVQETATGFIASFKKDLKMFSANIMEHLNKFQNSKFIGPIIKSPITKKFSALAGGALAFFVLVTGVNKAFKTGEIAIDDFKSQYKDFKNAA